MVQSEEELRNAARGEGIFPIKGVAEEV